MYSTSATGVLPVQKTPVLRLRRRVVVPPLVAALTALALDGAGVAALPAVLAGVLCAILCITAQWRGGARAATRPPSSAEITAGVEQDLFFRISMDLLAVLDIEDRLLAVNPAFAASLGYDGAEVLQRRLTDFIEPEDLPRAEALSRAVWAGEPFVAPELRFRRRDGSVRWLQWTGAVFPAEGLLYFTGRDVSEHRRDKTRLAAQDLEAGEHAAERARELAQAHAALARSEERYRGIFENMAASVWEEDFTEVCAALDALAAEGVVDLRGYLDAHPERVLSLARLVRVRDVNQASVPLLEAESKEALLAALDQVFVPETRALFVEELLVLAAGGTSYAGEMVVGTLRGGRRPMMVLARWQRGPERIVQGLITLVDIAELRRTERRLQEALADLSRSNVDLEQFAYVASHDLRAPLRAIDSLASWLEEDLAPVLNEETREHMALLRGRVRRMERLLGDLLEYARAGRISDRAEPVDVGALVADAVELCANVEGVVVAAASPLPIIETARQPLKQVLLNLIDNAVKHRDGPSCHVEIGAREDGELWHFTISDDGPGIAPQYHERVFQMFQTLKPRDLVEGSGMGLALVKRIVEAAGGSISLESEGRGARFRFSWPRRWRAAEAVRDLWFGRPEGSAPLTL